MNALLHLTIEAAFLSTLCNEPTYMYDIFGWWHIGHAIVLE